MATFCGGRSTPCVDSSAPYVLLLNGSEDDCKIMQYSGAQAELRTWHQAHDQMGSAVNMSGSHRRRQ